jgi:hypothetical protein
MSKFIRLKSNPTSPNHSNFKYLKANKISKNYENNIQHITKDELRFTKLKNK